MGNSSTRTSKTPNLQDIARKSQPGLMNIFSAFTRSADYTEHYRALFIGNLMDRMTHNSPGAVAVMSAIEFYDSTMPGFPTLRAAEEERAKIPEEDLDETAFIRGYSQDSKRKRVYREDWEAAREYISGLAAHTKKDAETNKPLKVTNYLRLLDRLGFEQDIQDVGLLLCVYADCPLFQSFHRNLGASPEQAGTAAAIYLNRPEKAGELDKLLSPNGKLASFGLIDTRSMIMGSSPEIPVPDHVVRARLSGPVDDDELIDRVVGKPTQTELDETDFAYLSQFDGIIKEIRSALDTGEKGFNVLLVGPEGTGKTELAKVIAKSLGVQMYSIGENEPTLRGFEYDAQSEGLVPVEDEAIVETHHHRLKELKRAQLILEDNQNVVLLMDEAEDLWPKSEDATKASDPDSKIQSNRLLETNAVPTIYAINDIGKFHKSFVDRFQIVLEVDTQPTLVRQNMWARQADLLGIDLDNESTLNLARKFSVSPRKIKTAIKSAMRTKGGVKAIENRLETNAPDINAIREATPIPPEFGLDMYAALGADIPPEPGEIEPDIRRLIQMANEKYPFSLFMTVGDDMDEQTLLSYIAEQAVMNPLVYDAGYLATDEATVSADAKISGVFEGASNLGRMLMITNIDRFAGWAEKGSKWESDPLTQTFLEKARQHKVPFAVTVSGDKREVISEKARSIFSENLHLTDIREQNVPAIFKRFFGKNMPKKMDCSGLRPMDFYNVRQLSKRTPDLQKPTAIAQLLHDQKDLRHKNKVPDIGF